MTGADHNQRRRAPRQDPVPIFFGPTGPGPFSLLGLEPGVADPARVFEALHARLAQLARHPQAATPAGEEVSLALHAAAAQLSDPAVQRILLRTWDATESSSADSDGALLGEPIDLHPDVDIERDLHLAVGLSGGWNARAMQRFALACRTKGVDIAQAIRALNWASQPRSIPRAIPKLAAETVRAPRIPPRNAQATPPPPDRPSTLRHPIPRDAIALLAIGGLGILFIVAAIILLTPAARPPLPGPVLSESSASAPLALSPTDAARSVAQPLADAPGELDAGNPRAITLEISGAMQDLASDPVAAHARFARAHDAFGKTWPLMSADETAAVVSAIVDFCYGASRLDTPTAQTITKPLHANLAAGKANVRAAAAAVAIAGRLVSERELPRAFLDQIESAATVGERGVKVEPSSAFRVGLERNLSNLANAIASTAPASADAWAGFMEVRDAALADRQPARDIATLNAIELVLRTTGVPVRDLVRPISALAPSLSWRPSDELRTALSGWLEDATVPSDLISEITRAMVASSAPGVDSTMVLPAGSGPEARSNLRERLAQAWQGAAVPTEPEDFAAWIRWAETLLYAEAKTDSERLWTAGRISRASLAANTLRAGKTDEAGRIIAADASTPPSAPTVTLPALPKPEANSKALEYAAAGSSVQARLEILRQVQSASARPDLLLADVLVNESARGTPASIRDLARAELRKHAAEPAIVLATLRLLPSIPETPENAEWVSEVAGSGQWKRVSKWKTAAQLALLDRAIELFPVSPNENLLSASARQLADSWVERSGDGDAPATADPLAAIEALESALASATRAPRGAPAGLNASDIRRRLAARSEIAPGPIERAVALQAACVEWSALGVAHERPGDIAAVRQIVEQWNASRRAAATSTEQLLEGERAMLRLQLLRVAGKVKSS